MSQENQERLPLDERSSINEAEYADKFEFTKKENHIIA